MIRFIRLTVFVFGVVLSSFLIADPLVFGIVPQQSAKKLAATWSPMLAELSKRTGFQVIFSTAKDIPTFERRLAEGKYDIAYMNPYHFVDYHGSSSYQALAGQKNKRIQGILVTRKDSGNATLSDLNNQTLAFPAPAAFSATIISQAILREEQVNTKAKYVSSHDSVYLNMARGFMPAGGGVMGTLKAAPSEVQSQLSILWKSEKYTSHAIATKTDPPEDTREIILAALLSMNDDEGVSNLLEAINFSGFEKANNSDWDDVRNLDIQILSGESE